MQISFPFARSYEIEVLDRIQRDFSGQRVVAFPGGAPVDPQQELADAPILRVEPREADPWIGIFYGGGLSPYGPELVGWPDEESFCVVKLGLGTLVNATNPDIEHTIASEAITGVSAVAAAGVVVFADFTTLTCYDRSGLRWQSDRLAWDDVRVEAVDAENGIVRARGYDPMARDTDAAFSVDLATGRSADKPWSG